MSDGVHDQSNGVPQWRSKCFAGITHWNRQDTLVAVCNTCMGQEPERISFKADLKWSWRNLKGELLLARTKLKWRNITIRPWLQLTHRQCRRCSPIRNSSKWFKEETPDHILLANNISTVLSDQWAQEFCIRSRNCDSGLERPHLCQSITLRIQSKSLCTQLN